MNHLRMQLQRAECPDTEDNDCGYRQRTKNVRNQEDTDGMASLKRCEQSAIRTVPPTRIALTQQMNGFVEYISFHTTTRLIGIFS